jgi:hypothetical protein
MLKLFFICLVAGNVLLFAYHRGHLEGVASSGREPARMAAQFNASQIRLLPPPVAPAAPLVPPATPPAATLTPIAAATSGSGTGTLVAEIAAARKTLIACTEVGNFNSLDARRFEAQLTALTLGDKLVRREIREMSSHMVWIPPQAAKEGADKKAGELRNLGINDFYVILENTPQRWGISLGVFKTEDAARAHLAALGQKGVRSARLIEHKMPLTKTAFQLRQLDAGGKDILDRVRANFAGHEVRDCVVEAPATPAPASAAAV